MTVNKALKQLRSKYFKNLLLVSKIDIAECLMKNGVISDAKSYLDIINGEVPKKLK